VRAAEECLPALRDRAHRSGNGLLRAAETDSVSLLRAADSRPGIDSATLLRAEEGNSCD
jgi:hypothetical protein